MHKRKLTILIVLSFLFLIVFGSAYTFGLFHSEVNGDVNLDVAKWNIEVNDTNISNGITDQFTINDIVYENEVVGNVVDNKFAPGVKGTYTLEIDPTDTSVSIKYEIIVEDEKFKNENIKITSLTLEDGELIQKDENTYVGVILLSKKTVHTIKINLEWINEEKNNAVDSAIGTRENPDLEIPVTVIITQYLGEDLT